MPFSVYYADDGRGFEVVLSGAVKREEILLLARRTEPSVELAQMIRYVLVDLTDTIYDELSGEDVRDCVAESAHNKGRDPSRQIAIIAPADHIYGISRMYQTLAERMGANVQIFRSREEAQVWIRTVVTAATFVRDANPIQSPE